MNKWYCLIMLLLTCRVCDGQNLVPNPSFEDTIACPTYYSYHFPKEYNGVINAPPWFTPTMGTSDYFNECNDTVVGIPFNFFGYQLARTGKAYMGLYTGSPSYREYISAPLLSSLQAGVKYFASMYVNLSCNGNSCSEGTDILGMYFSNGKPDTTGVNWAPLTYLPQVANTAGNILADTLVWMKISGSFVATGSENYITIGGFGSATNNIVGYYYVSVSIDSEAGINTMKNENELILFPNPFIDNINIIVKGNGLFELYLYDVTARQILQKSFTNSTSLNAAQLAKGVYLYEIRNKNGVIRNGKIVKE